MQSSIVCTRALNFFRIQCQRLLDQAAVDYCMEGKYMSNELVCIAKLYEWFPRLRTFDIENMIDAVPAYDLRSAAVHARISLDKQEMVEKGDTSEGLPHPDNWREHRIFSQEAKSLAERIIIFPSHIAHIFDTVEKVLGKEISIYPDEFTPYDRWEDRIAELKHNDELFNEVYDTFLKLLYVNKIDSIRYIISNKYELSLEITSDIKELIKKIENETHASGSSQQAADPISPDACTSAMAQGGSRPETDKIKATKVACENLIGAIVQGSHRDSKGKIGMNEFLSLVRETMEAQGTIGQYQPTAARRIFSKAVELEPLKRRRGEKS